MSVRVFLLILALNSASTSAAQESSPPSIREILGQRPNDLHELDFLKEAVLSPDLCCQSTGSGDGLPSVPRHFNTEPVYVPGGGVTKPRAIYSQNPEYSEEGRNKNVVGTVLLAVVVASDGSTHDVRVRKGIGAGLDEKAVGAISRWRWQAATRDGKPVAVELTISVTFNLFGESSKTIPK
jgi:TonB family protein